jgi:hypothetical protein
MSQIVLTDKQAKIVAESSGNVVIRDAQGRHLGYLSHGFTAKDIAEAQRRLAAPGPRYSTAEVLARLQELDQK